MKKLGAVLIVVIMGIIFLGAYVSNYNYGNRAENIIVAEYTNMENILGQYSLAVSESVQLPKMKKDDFREAVEASMQARYGSDGSKAAFQWLQENYPGEISDELYVNVQQTIESGRHRFENAQTKFIDTKRLYETNLGYLWKGFWLNVAGYPKIDLNEYAIITSQHASDTFESKIDKGLDLSPDK